MKFLHGQKGHPKNNSLYRHETRRFPHAGIPAFGYIFKIQAAARLGDTANPRKESSGSQFYIVHNPETCVHLDGEYTVFGETLDGFDVIDRIASLRTDAYDRPLKEARIISITPVI